MEFRDYDNELTRFYKAFEKFLLSTNETLGNTKKFILTPDSRFKLEEILDYNDYQFSLLRYEYRELLPLNKNNIPETITKKSEIDDLIIKIELQLKNINAIALNLKYQNTTVETPATSNLSLVTLPNLPTSKLPDMSVSKNINYKKYKEKFDEGKFTEAKKYYEEYLTDKNDFRIMNMNICGIVEEYLEILIKLYKLDISEKNPLFTELNKAKISIETKNGQQLSEYESNVSKLLVYQSHYKLNWHIYSGLSIENIIRKDPDYILMCILNLDHFAINNTVFLPPIVFNNESLFMLAVEKNLIKQLIINKWKNDEEDEDCRETPWSDEMTFRYAFDCDKDAWDHFNQ